MKKIIIAIDGPAGSGKSTSARMVANQLGYTYLDTGAMYRAITLAAIRRSDSSDDNSIDKLLNEIDIRVEQGSAGQRTFLNSEDVTERIRQSDVTSRVSKISSLASVRTKLVQMQQQLGKEGGIVMDGRDIGTVVFPNAELKIFLVASITARAKRRLLEVSGTVSDASITEVALELERRDEIDSSRELSPLVKASDAIEIDTSELTIAEQVEKIVRLAKARISVD